MGDGFEITCTASSPVARGGKLKNVELALPACKKLALMDKGLKDGFYLNSAGDKIHTSPSLGNPRDIYHTP